MDDKTRILIQSSGTFRDWVAFSKEGERLDLRGETFTKQMTIDHLQYTELFDRCDVTGATFVGNTIKGIQLNRQPLEYITFNACTFSLCTFSDQTFRKLNIHGSEFSQCKFVNTVFLDSEFRNFNLTKTYDDDSCSYIGCSFYNVQLSGTIESAAFINCTFTDCTFNKSVFANCKFINCVVYDCDSTLSKFGNTIGVDRIRNIETVKRASSTADCFIYFEKILLPWYSSMFTWAWIRMFGNLPLFGVSYATIILIPALAYFIDIYNREVDDIRHIAEKVESEIALINHAIVDHSKQIVRNNEKNDITAKKIDIALSNYIERTKNVNYIRMPGQTIVVFIGSICLAIASSLYAYSCPAVVKEFSIHAWVFQMGKQVHEYLPLSWSQPCLRFVCGIMYIIGATLVSYVLLIKIINSFSLIVKHS